MEKDGNRFMATRWLENQQKATFVLNHKESLLWALLKTTNLHLNWSCAFIYIGFSYNC